LSDIT
jgi:2-oxo-4-hydroxy-4-carboxy--5-ureidoimidazoline (OHCU) decarboxylase